MFIHQNTSKVLSAQDGKINFNKGFLGIFKPKDFDKINTALQMYNIRVQAADGRSKSFAENLAKINPELSNYLVGLKGAEGTMKGYGVHLVGATIKTVALQAASMALNAALTWGVSLVIQGIIYGIKWLIKEIPTVANLTRKLKETADAFKETKDEITSLNDELTTTQDRINELKAKGTLSFTEASELKRLEAENAERAHTIWLLEQENKERAKNAQILFNQAAKIDSNKDLSYFHDDKDTGNFLTDFANDYNSSNSYSASTVEAYRDMLDDLFTSGYEYGSDATTDKKIDDIYRIVDAYDAYCGATDTLYATIAARPKYAKANEEIQNLFEAGNLNSESLSNLYNTNKSIKEFVDYLFSLGTTDAKNVTEFLSLLPGEFKKIEESAEGATTSTTAFTNLSKDISSMVDKYDALSEAQKELAELGNLSVDTLKKLAEKYPELNDDIGEYLFGLISQEELMNRLQGQYNTDYSNYQKTMQSKLETSVEYYNSLLSTNATAINKIGESYKVDLSNCETIEKAKIKIREASMTAWMKQYNQYVELTRNEARTLLRDLTVRNRNGVNDQKIADLKAYIKLLDGIDVDFSKINSAKLTKLDPKKLTTNDIDKNKNQTIEAVEKQIEALKHQHEMGLISEATYYKKLEAIRKKYYAGKKDYLDRDRELQEEYHDWEVKNAEDGFEKKIESLQEKYVNGKITYAKLQSELTKLVNKTFSKDVDTKNKYLAEIPDYLEDAVEKYYKAQQDSFDTDTSNLKNRLEMGKITEATYYKELKKIRDKYNKLNNQDLKDDIENLDKELHDYEIEKAEKSFEAKLKVFQENYANGKYSDATFKTQVANAIKSLFKNDLQKQKELLEELNNYLEEAKELKDEKNRENFDLSYDKLKYQLENGFIAEVTYYKKLDALYKKHYGDKTKYLDEYAQYSQEVYDGFKDMYKEDLEADKESLEKKKEAITEYYDELIEKIQDAHDDEDYEKEQSEKRKEIFDLDMQIAELMRDGSEKAKARIAELEEERLQAEEELLDFETDKAREDELSRLEKEKEKREKEVQDKIDNIDEKLGNLDTNTTDIRNAVIQYAKAKGVDIKFAYASGTRSSVGGFGRINEKGIEMISAPDGNGNYIPMLPSSYVFSAKATEFLYRLATDHSLPQAMYNSIAKSINTQSGTPSVNIAQPINITMGDVIIKGNADKQTVFEIKKQRESDLRWILGKLKELQK